MWFFGILFKRKNFEVINLIIGYFNDFGGLYIEGWNFIYQPMVVAVFVILI